MIDALDWARVGQTLTEILKLILHIVVSALIGHWFATPREREEVRKVLAARFQFTANLSS